MFAAISDALPDRIEEWAYLNSLVLQLARFACQNRNDSAPKPLLRALYLHQRFARSERHFDMFRRTETVILDDYDNNVTCKLRSPVTEP